MKNTKMKDRIAMLEQELDYEKNENVRLINGNVTYQHLLLISMIGNLVLVLIAFA